jgi:deazaflavin-dependent oxidoreductase (nitroreductase family)
VQRPDARIPAWSGVLTAPLAALIPARRRPLVLTAIKATHTAIFFSIAAAIGVTVWDGARGRPSRRTAIAGGVVIGESAVYLSNNQVCPLTPLAEHLGARRGSVVDIFLPGWVARRIPLVAGGAAVTALALNLRAVFGRRRATSTEGYVMEGSVPLVNRVLALFGWVPILTVRGRRSGRPRSVPLAPVAHNGSRYIVAVRGPTNWARNLAAAGQGELHARGRTEVFRSVEVDGPERIAVVAAYQKAHGRFLKGMGPIPGPEQQTVFRVEPLDHAKAA